MSAAFSPNVFSYIGNQCEIAWGKPRCTFFSHQVHEAAKTLSRGLEIFQFAAKPLDAAIGLVARVWTSVKNFFYFQAASISSLLPIPLSIVRASYDATFGIFEEIHKGWNCSQLKVEKPAVAVKSKLPISKNSGTYNSLPVSKTSPQGHGRSKLLESPQKDDKKKNEPVNIPLHISLTDTNSSSQKTEVSRTQLEAKVALKLDIVKSPQSQEAVQ